MITKCIACLRLVNIHFAVISLFLIICIWIPVVSNAQTILNNDKHFQVLEAHFQKQNSSLYSLLQLSKDQLAPSTTKEEGVEILYRLTGASCTLYSEIDPLIQSSYIPLSIDEMYQKNDEQNQYYKLKKDNLEFWVSRDCVKEVSTASKGSFIYQWQSGKAGKLELIKKVRSLQEADYSRFRQYLTKNKKDLLIPGTSNYKTEFRTIIERIERKKSISDQVYNKLIETLYEPSLASNKLTVIDRLKISAQVLFGSSNLQSQFQGSRNIENNGGNTDLDVNGSYTLNSNSLVRFHLKNRNQTLISPYNTLNVGGGYQTATNGNKIEVNGGINTFSDKVNTQNDNSRFHLGGQLSNSSKKNMDYGIRYQFINQSNSRLNTGAFSKHSFNGTTTFNKNKVQNLILGLDFNAGQSDNALFDYTFINPHLTIARQEGSSSSRLLFSAETTSFSQNEMLSNNRFQMKYLKNRRSESGKNHSGEVGLIYRQYPELTSSDYLDFFIRRSRRSFNSGSNSLLLRMRYIPDLLEASHMDLRYSIERDSRTFLKFDNNIRLTYPGDVSILGRLDGYFKLGFDFKSIKIGPIFRWHMTYDFKNPDLGSYDYNQNNYQYGVEARGNLSAMNNALKIYFRVSYDANTVYSRVASFGFPNPTIETFSRNPSNLQLDVDLAYLVNRRTELFLRIDRFDNNTGFENEPTPNVLLNNNGTKFNIGVRVRNY